MKFCSKSTLYFLLIWCIFNWNRWTLENNWNCTFYLITLRLIFAKRSKIFEYLKSILRWLYFSGTHRDVNNAQFRATAEAQLFLFIYDKIVITIHNLNIRTTRVIEKAEIRFELSNNCNVPFDTNRGELLYFMILMKMVLMKIFYAWKCFMILMKIMPLNNKFYFKLWNIAALFDISKPLLSHKIRLAQVWHNNKNKMLTKNCKCKN